ncbi:hypothetical protein SMD20_01950 [Nonomuraea sp. LP-02]|uniref:hypothetical protein n=1 Tax=Nonomuraea sp. LP-02 TaxID=3097960 RepID=UPI002E34CD0C|nr:hypothetical protein [Nonomuraea sp. LP-02]MED7922981.1 hypothetical protein [Nonomuraea sp. LP-02]
MLGDTARSYRTRRRSRLIHLVLPGAGPQIAAGARQALCIGIILLGLVGIALSMVFRAVEARLPRWYTGLRTAQREG